MVNGYILYRTLLVEGEVKIFCFISNTYVEQSFGMQLIPNISLVGYEINKFGKELSETVQGRVESSLKNHTVLLFSPIR